MSAETPCPSCGAAVAATAKFCRSCGASLQAAQSTGEATQVLPPSPEAEAVLAKMTESQKAYAELAEDLKAGRIDEDAFRRAALPHGVIVREREAWIMDAAAGRWLYYDGVQVRDLDAEME